MDMILARSEDNVIAINCNLPWRMPTDLKLFKRITTGNTILMGRKTFDSIGQRLLPNRENIVFSRSLERRDCVIERTYSRLKHYTDSIVIGGCELYQYCLDNDLISTIYMSVINVDYSKVSDYRKTFGPIIDENKYRVASISDYQKRPEDEFKYRLEVWKKR